MDSQRSLWDEKWGSSEISSSFYSTKVLSSSRLPQTNTCHSARYFREKQRLVKTKTKTKTKEEKRPAEEQAERWQRNRGERRQTSGSLYKSSGSRPARTQTRVPLAAEASWYQCEDRTFTAGECTLYYSKHHISIF